MHQPSPTNAMRQAARSGGAGIVLLLCLLVAGGIFFWLSQHAGRRAAPTPVAAPPEGTGAVFQALGSTQSIAAVAQAHAQNVLHGRIAAMTAVVRERLDEAYPMFRTNDAVELRLTNGIITRGLVQTLTMDNVTLGGEEGTNTVEWPAMDVHMAMRFNDDLRSTWVHFRAATLARAGLVTNGYELLQSPADSGETAEEAAEQGDTPALLKMGLGVLGQKPLTWEDAAHGYLMIRAAALAGNADAQNALGQLIVRSTLWGPGPQDGLVWIASAAAAGNTSAQQFLESRRETVQRLEGALQQQREQDRVEREAYAQRLELARQRDIERAAAAEQQLRGGHRAYSGSQGSRYYYDDQGQRHTLSGR